MNGEAILHLKTLTTLWLDKNECIDGNFESPTLIAAFSEVVTQNCGYNDSSIENSASLPDLTTFVVTFCLIVGRSLVQLLR